MIETIVGANDALLTLEAGDDAVSQIAIFCKKKNVKTAYISGYASVKRVVEFPNRKGVHENHDLEPAANFFIRGIREEGLKNNFHNMAITILFENDQNIAMPVSACVVEGGVIGIRFA